MDHILRDQRPVVKIDLNESHRYDGFRSRLESEVAAELDRLNIHHAYEQPWIRESDGYQPKTYLPDFTIEPSEAAEALWLPRWVEVKPQKFLYQLFETFNLARRYGDRFEQPFSITNIDHVEMRKRHIEELWKPKYLAELTGENVLIVGGVNKTKTLSVEMAPDQIIFSRTHPFVNQEGVRQEERRRQREEEWEAERIARERMWRADQERRQREEDRRNRTALEQVRKVITGPSMGTPRFASPCMGCGQRVQQHASLYRVLMSSGTQEWRVVCFQCKQKASS
jgi:hypothetical protein